jgi:hypothetical protein
MAIESGADLVMALLFAPGQTDQRGEEVRGITRLEKLIFLLLKEGGFEGKTGSELAYEAYDYGPYSGELVDILDALKGEGLVQSRPATLESFKEVADGLVVAVSRSPEASVKPKTVEIYGLTAKGRTIGEAVFRGLTKGERDSIASIKKRFNHLSLNELLEYVYKRYPKMIEKSRIMDQILGLGSRPDLPAFEESE